MEDRNHHNYCKGVIYYVYNRERKLVDQLHDDDFNFKRYNGKLTDTISIKKPFINETFFCVYFENSTIITLFATKLHKMKIAKLSICGVFILLATACQKGDKGDTGPTGPTGATGTTNVSVELYLNQGLTPNSGVYQVALTDPQITGAVYDSGVVMGYWRTPGTNTWYEMANYGTSSNMYFSYTTNAITVYSITSGPFDFKFDVIPAQ